MKQIHKWGAWEVACGRTFFPRVGVSLERENQVKPVLADGWTKRKGVIAGDGYQRTTSTQHLLMAFLVHFFPFSLRREFCQKRTNKSPLVHPALYLSELSNFFPVSVVIYSVSSATWAQILALFFLFLKKRKKRLNSRMVIGCTSIRFDFIYAICSVLKACTGWVMADKNKLSGRQMQQPDRPWNVWHVSRTSRKMRNFKKKTNSQINDKKIDQKFFGIFFF